MQRKRLFIGSILIFLTLIGWSQVSAQTGGFSLTTLSADVTCIVFPLEDTGGVLTRGIDFNIQFDYDAGAGAYLWEQSSFVNASSAVIGPSSISGQGTSSFATSTGDGSLTLPYQYALKVRLYSLDTNFNNVFNPAGTILAEIAVDGECTEQSEPPSEGSAAKVSLPFAPHDGRLQPDAAAPAAVYCVSSGLQVYGIDSESQGHLVMSISKEALSANAPAENTLLDSVPGIALYHLTTGEFQINATQSDGKTYVLTWGGCPG